MGWGSLISAGINLGASLFTSHKHDKAARSAANANRAINMALYQFQKKQINWKRAIDEQDIKRRAVQIEGAQRAGYAGAGVRMSNSGTVRAMLDETRQAAERDLERIRAQAGYDIGAAEKRAELANAAQTTVPTVGATLLTSGAKFVAGGLSDTGNSWYGFKF